MDNSGTMTASYLETTLSLKSIVDRVDPFLKDDLLRGMLELLAGKPASVRQRPVAAATVNPAVPQQEGKQLLAFAAKVVLAASRDLIRSRTASCAASGAQTLVSSPARCSRASVTRIAPVRLDALRPAASGSGLERPPCNRDQAP
jgi:hypothetical protein